VGLLLGMSANSVSALAYRAREGLRQAFLSMHVRETDDDACAWTRERLGAYLRTGVSRRDRSRIEGHLAECRPCAAIYLEVADVNSNLSGLIAPALLGGTAAAYVASSGGTALASGGLLGLLGGARELVLAHMPATAAAGVGAGALVVGGLFLAVRAPEPPPQPAVPEARAPGELRDGPPERPVRPARPDERASRREPSPRSERPHQLGAPAPSPPDRRPIAWPGPRPVIGRVQVVQVPAPAAASRRVEPSTPAPARDPREPARTQVDLRITVTPRPPTGEVSLRARAGGLLAGKTATVALPPDRTPPAP
jgi:hypothetical protein